MTRRPGMLSLRFQGASLLWPILGLLALAAFNLVFSPSFFHLEIRDGHLYGTLVDILNQGSKVMLLALRDWISMLALRFTQSLFE